MASIRSSSVNGNAGSTAISVTAPTGTTAGDTVVLVINTNGDSAGVADNNGSTPFTVNLNRFEFGPGSGIGGFAYVWSRKIVAGDPSSYAFTSTGATRWGIIAVAVQNPNPTAVYNVAPITGNSASASAATTVSAVSITTLGPNTIHCAVGLADGTAITGTPAGYTVQQNGGSQQIAFTTLPVPSPGATGAQAFTVGVAISLGALSFAIADAGQGALLSDKRFMAVLS